jgi:hypothetical protein
MNNKIKITLSKPQIESQIGDYIIGREHSIPKELKEVGEKATYYKSNIAQRLYFKTEEQIKEIIGDLFYVSLKRDGIFACFYYNEDIQGKYQSFFVNAPTHRIYLGLPVSKKIEKYLKDKDIKSCLLCGELIASKRDPPDFTERCRVYDFTYYSRSPKKPSDVERIGFRVFDVLELNDTKYLEERYERRYKALAILEGLLEDSGKMAGIVETKSLKKGEIKPYYDEALKEGWEGIVIRSGNYGYKIKPIQSVDAVVIGFAVGEMGSRIGKDQVSSLLTALRYKDGTYQILTKVGGGLTDLQREELFKRLNPLVVKSKGFYPTKSDGRSYHLINPTIVMEIYFLDLITDNRGKRIKQNCVVYNENEKEWRIIDRRDFPKLISPRFPNEPIREDKSPESIRDVRISQITDLIDMIPSHEITPKRKKESQIIYLLIFKKHYRNSDYISKFVALKTEKEHLGYPPYVIAHISYSHGRKDPIKRDMQITFKENIKEVFEDFVSKKMISEGTGSLTRGWEVYYGDDTHNRIKGFFKINGISFDQENIKKYQLRTTKELSEKERIKETITLLKELLEATREPPWM